MGSKISIFNTLRVHDALSGTGLESYARIWIDQSRQIFTERRHGDMEKWLAAIQRLPEIQSDRVDIDRRHITVRATKEVEVHDLDRIENALMVLHPWRKGPFDLFGLEIDSEWRSDLKWRRLSQQIAPLTDRTVLDVGCGNGYYSLLMQGAGARLVIGVDQHIPYVAQF